MTIKEAVENMVVDKYTTYIIGFNGNDETELSAYNIDDLEELWCSLCEEFGCAKDSIDYIEIVDGITT